MRRDRGTIIIKDRIIDLLKLNNMSIKELAKNIGYTREGLSRIIHLGKMPMGTIYMIASCLNVDVRYLTGETDFKNITDKSPNKPIESKDQISVLIKEINYWKAKAESYERTFAVITNAIAQQGGTE